MYTVGAACLYPGGLAIKQHFSTALMAQAYDLSCQALKLGPLELRFAQLQQAHAARQRSLEPAHELGFAKALRIADEVKPR